MLFKINQRLSEANSFQAPLEKRTKVDLTICEWIRQTRLHSLLVMLEFLTYMSIPNMKPFNSVTKLEVDIFHNYTLQPSIVSE